MRQRRRLRGQVAEDVGQEAVGAGGGAPGERGERLARQEADVFGEEAEEELGEEVGGINPGLLRQCNKAVEIPMYGKKESLNVSVAFGVAAYEISKYL